MAIRSVSAAWRTQHQSGALVRLYADFRQRAYPPVSGTPTFTVVDPADNQPGDLNLTGGSATYLLPIDSKITLHVRCKPGFAYNVGSDQPLWSWYVDADHYLTLLYAQASDKYVLKWKDGGTERTLESGAYTSDETLQVWTDICVVADLAAGTAALYIDRTATDTSWSGAADALASYFPTWGMACEGAAEGNYQINHVRLFLGLLASSGDVADDFASVTAEEVYWSLDGHALGRTRCNITRFLKGYSADKDVEKPGSGAQSANQLSVDLWSLHGEWADDQYAAFDPTADQFNGTSAQKYLQTRFPIMLETWYGHLSEPAFYGRLTADLVQRSTDYQKVSTVTLEAEDFIADVDATALEDPGYHEDKDLCDSADEGNSLVHLLGRRATARRIYNFAANSSFENATIGNSWAVSGTGATLARVSGGLLGSYCGELVYGSAAARVQQTITFTGTRKLSVGERWTFAIYLESASDCGATIGLAEADSGGDNDESTAAWTLAAGAGWKRFEVAHTVTDETSDRLVVRVNLDDNVTLHLDCAMLVEAERATDWFVLNNNDGAAAVESADDADYAAYDEVGYDCDSVDIQHPWAVIEAKRSIWEHMKEIANAVAARYFGASAAGVFRMRSPLKTGYTDPTPLFTISAMRDMATEIDDETANKITVGGVKIVKRTEVVEAWNASAAGLVVPTPVDDGETWPPTADYGGEYWAQYENASWAGGTVSTLHNVGRNPHDVTVTSKLKRVVTNSKEQEVIGLQSPAFVFRAAQFLSGIPIPVTFTQTIFDTATRPDAAKILLTNATGSQASIMAAAIRGKLVVRYSGSQGWINDKHVDRASILRDGEQPFELTNNFIVTADQANKLADYYWKDLGKKKHIYEITTHGELLHIEPGEWYTLQIGGAGEPEYVDTKVRCVSVSVQRDYSGIGETTIVLREVEENWKFDSNKIARFLASGNTMSLPSGVVFVGTSTYVGPADYYLPGAADETVLQEAIDDVAGANGGGVVMISAGQVNLTDTVDVWSRVSVVSTAGTIISHTGNADVFRFESGGEYIQLDGLRIENGETVNWSKLLVNFNGASRSILQRCVLAFAAAAGVSCDGDFNKIIGNTLEGGRASPAYDLLDTGAFYAGTVTSVRTARLSDDLGVIAYVRATNRVQAKVVSTTGAALQYGDEQDIDVSGTYGTIEDVARLDATHFVITLSAGTTIVAYVCEVGVDEETITPGTVATMTSAGYGGAVDALSGSLFVVGFRQSGGSAYAQAIACTVSGTTITPGSATSLDTSGGAQALYDIAAVNATQFAAVFQLVSGWGVYVVAGSISGTTITPGAKVLVYTSTTTSAASGRVAALTGSGNIVVTSGSTSGAGGAHSCWAGAVSASNVVTMALSSGAQFAAATNLYTLHSVDGMHFIVSYRDGDGYGNLRLGTVYATSVVLEDPYLFLEEQYTGESALMSSDGLILTVYPTVVPNGDASLILATITPEAIALSGNGNIIQGNHILGLADYQQDVGVHVTGDDNSIADNVIDGLVDPDRLIDAGIVIATGSRNSLSGNRVANCAVRGVVNAGANTLFDNTNTLYNNGASTGVETV